MAKYYQKFFPFRGSVHWLDKERNNLVIFAFLAAVLATLSVFHSYYQLRLSTLEGYPVYSYGVATTGTPELSDKQVKPAQDDTPEVRKYRGLAEFLSKKYLVSQEATESLVMAAFDAAGQTGLDPLLIIAVMAVESRFNPIAESVAGAKGLMQVIPKFHREKFLASGGEVLDPKTNILVGATVLKEYIKRSGSLIAGLQMYAGAPNDPANGYSNKVIGEKQRLQRVVKQLRA